jgi:hypothetical protein
MRSNESLKKEMQSQAVEPLLPVERSLIGWSLGLGIGLLALMLALRALFGIL